MGAIRHLDDRDLHATLAQSRGLVQVDFHAAWCGPCRALAPSLDALADETGERLAVIKVDIDQAPVAAHAFGVRSVPTLLLLDEGRIRDTRVGLQTLAQLRTWVASMVPPPSGAYA
jgi:thioredoxin 1